MDDRQSLYVNLLEVRVKEQSDGSLEEQGITQMFIDCCDASKRRRNVQENKDTYRIGVRRRKPSKGYLKRRLQADNKTHSVDEEDQRQYKTEVSVTTIHENIIIQKL